MSTSRNINNSESSIMPMALNTSFSNKGCNRIFNAYIKDAVMCLNSTQFTSMAFSKSSLRRYPWKLQKLLFGLSAAAARVWHSGTISSSLSESCSKILLAVLKVLQWKALLPSLFIRWRSFSKTLIPFKFLVLFF